MSLGYFTKQNIPTQVRKVLKWKVEQIRMTGMASANAAGDELPMFVIGKARTPHCFKNVKFLPCRYRHQKKSWMDGILFEEWVRELDRKFLSEGRNVALVIDNCPAHPNIENLKRSNCFSTSEHNFYNTADGSRCNKIPQNKVPYKCCP